jgi:FYVE, RhoGEF and PH domain containing 5/6
METECTIKGWLQRLVNRSWKKMWFVLKEQVLYAYKASEDVVAIETTPVLGFCVERPVRKSPHENPYREITSSYFAEPDGGGSGP